MSFKIKDQYLKRLCQINHFQVPAEGIIFLGFRGCLPIDENDQEYRTEQTLNIESVDHLHPRCTLGQWLPENKEIALFPGSTVPHLKYVKISKERNGVGANQLMTGYYRDYRQGKHRAGTPYAHDAFRQTNAHPIRRTADDFDFDNDDRVEFVNPYDNIHAAWSMGINHDSFGSAGCQVIVGYPKCQKRGDKPSEGPWKIFQEKAYDTQQVTFPYILLNGRDIQKVTVNGSQKMSARLRFGSKGELVSKVQEVLKGEEYYEGHFDGDFGKRTIRAVLDYQTQIFGPSADDGIIGPITASALGIDWPKV